MASPTAPQSPEKLRGALLRYRVMAFVVGTMLLILFAIVIGQHVFGYGLKTPEKIVAPLHGYLYLVYLVAAADLAVRARFRIPRLLVVICAGFVPGLAFYIEHRITSQLRAEWATEVPSA